VEAVARCGLGVGRELDRPLARALARELRRSDALRAAVRILGRRDVSTATLEARLARRSAPPAAVAGVLRTLEDAGVVDDARFAAARAQALASRGYGDEAIRNDLERQGVAAELAAGALDGLEPERERARGLVARRGRTAATASYLARRGFEHETVADVLGPVVAGED
jgi:regulatory protein